MNLGDAYMRFFEKVIFPLMHVFFVVARALFLASLVIFLFQ